VANGTIDLQAGKLRPYSNKDYITKCIPINYDKDAKQEEWTKRLAEIFEDDEEMVDYVQRCLGYSITGDASEHCLFIPLGDGRNGKNVVLDPVKRVLGEYGWTIDPKLLLCSQKSSNHDAEALAHLHGKRFVLTDEIDQESTLFESMVKRTTGNSVISARFLYGKTFEFPITFKVWMPTNYQPKIRGLDEGIWSRPRIIPFARFFKPEERIKGLADKLFQDEPEGILAWLVEGYRKYLKEGLEEPAKVKAASAAYRKEQDYVSIFIAECCTSYLDHPELKHRAQTEVVTLHDGYLEWCRKNQISSPLVRPEFGRGLSKLGYGTKDSNGRTFRLGIRLNDDPTDAYGKVPMADWASSQNRPILRS
jgi:putative DNA primase/helicase